MSRNTSSVSFFCRNSKVTKAGVAPLELGITINGKRVFVNLPIKAKPEEFARKRKPDYLQEYMDQTRVKVNEIITDMMRLGEPLTAFTLREYFRAGGVKSYTISDMVEGFLALKRKEATAGTMTYSHYRKYENARDVLFGYVDKDSEVTRLTPSLMQNVYVDLKCKYHPATAAAYMAKIKAIARYGIDNGKLQVNPFTNIKIDRGKNEIEMLSDEDFNKIKNKNIQCERIARVRDIFLFACGSGLAYIDLKHLTPNDFTEIGGRLCIVKPRHKTDNTFVAVLLPFAVEIAKKYDYDLSRIVLSNQKLNSYLTEIKDICGVTSVKSLHTHLGRHYYCNKLLNLGVRAEVVAKASGHSNYRTLLKYYARVEDNTTVAEISKAI